MSWKSQKEEAIKSEAYEKAGDIKKKSGEEAREDREDPGKMAEGEKHPENWSSAKSEIADVVSGWTKIPVRKLAGGRVRASDEAGVHPP